MCVRNKERASRARRLSEENRASHVGFTLRIIEKHGSLKTVRNAEPKPRYDQTNARCFAPWHFSMGRCQSFCVSASSSGACALNQATAASN
jgi:hypothetical protein